MPEVFFFFTNKLDNKSSVFGSFFYFIIFLWLFFFFCYVNVKLSRFLVNKNGVFSFVVGRY